MIKKKDKNTLHAFCSSAKKRNFANKNDVCHQGAYNYRFFSDRIFGSLFSRDALRLSQAIINGCLCLFR